MNDQISRREVDGKIQKPIAYLVCNFAAPVGDNPSLLTLRDVETIFHEFGHGLHHMLDAPNRIGRFGNQRCGMGRGRNAEPVHGELRSELGRDADHYAPCQDGQNNASRTFRQTGCR